MGFVDRRQMKPFNTRKPQLQQYDDHINPSSFSAYIYVHYLCMKVLTSVNIGFKIRFQLHPTNSHYAPVKAWTMMVLHL